MANRAQDTLMDKPEQVPTIRVYNTINNADIIEDTKKVVRGYFTGDIGKLAGSNLTTQSLSTANKNYYYNLQYSTKNQLSVAYGHLAGSGSTGTNGTLPNTLVGETEAVYKQHLNRVTGQRLLPDGGGNPNLKGFIFTGSIGDDAKPESNMYFMIADQERMYDGIEPGTWTIHLSGSGASKSGSFSAGTTGSDADLHKATGSLILKGGTNLENLEITIGTVTFTVVDPTLEQSMSAYSNTSTQYYIASGSELGYGAQAGGISSSMVHRLSNAVASASAVLNLSASAFTTSSNTVRLEFTASNIGSQYNLSASTNNPEQAYFAKSGVTTKLPEGSTYAIQGGYDMDTKTDFSRELFLTDDSSYVASDDYPVPYYDNDAGDMHYLHKWGPAGPRYNIVSGTKGGRVDKWPVYGWFYPKIGLWAFRGDEISGSIPGTTAYKTGSGFQGLSSAGHYGVGLTSDVRISGDVDNSIKLAHSLQLGTDTEMRSEEIQHITSYFCRARAQDFNGSNNPTWTSGSDGRMRNRDMEGNPETYITQIGLYNSDSELVAVGAFSKPVSKNWGEELTVKVNLKY